MLNQLPPELWIIVFRWATLPSDGYPAPYYEPFRSFPETLNEPLKTKRILVRVCRLWRALATVFLYEDVRIGCDLSSIKAVLSGGYHTISETFQGHSLGGCVHRLELPYMHTTTRSPGDTRDIIEILSSCTSLKTLVRPCSDAFPDSALFEFPAEIVSLPSLTRLEWWHYNNAARSGGINSLIDVLRNAPSLQYLTLGGEFWMNSMRLDNPLRLPALTTLRLRRINALFVWQIKQWDLPALVHIVADFPADHCGLEQLWDHFGSQLCIVEFGRNVAFHMTDQISSLLRGCSGVKVLNYFINFTAPPSEELLVEQCSLQCVGVHAFPCGFLDDNRRHIINHFNFLSSHLLPALKYVLLYGNWQSVIEDPRMMAVFDRLIQKGCTIQFPDHLLSPFPVCDHPQRCK